MIGRTSMRCVQAPLGRRLRGPTCPGHFSRVPLLLHQRKRPHTSSLPKKIVPQYLRFASNQAVPSGKGTWAPSTSRSSVAVVYGWLGASEKNLAKYGALYAEKGFSVHIARSPVLDILNPQRAAALAKDASEQALDLWERSGRPDRVVLHVMSMAGFLLSGLSLGALAQSPKGTAFLASIRGVVFDSAPCRITPDVAARGVLAAALPSLLTPGGDVPGAAVLLAPFRVYLSLDTVRGALLEAYGAWETLVPNSARLVLYSLADQVVPATGVREYVGAWERRGIDVEKKVWVRSRHVEHFRNDPEGYVRALDQFLGAIGADCDLR